MSKVPLYLFFSLSLFLLSHFLFSVFLSFFLLSFSVSLLSVSFPVSLFLSCVSFRAVTVSVRATPLFRTRHTRLLTTTLVIPLTTTHGVDSRKESPELHPYSTANQNLVNPLLLLVLTPLQSHPLAPPTPSLKNSSDRRAVELPRHHSKALPSPPCTARQAAWPQQLHPAHPVVWSHPPHLAHQLLAFPLLSD